MELYLLALFAPMLILGIIFVIIFSRQDRKQAKER
jgi:preprotein translocase subunit YajC